MSSLPPEARIPDVGPVRLSGTIGDDVRQLLPYIEALQQAVQVRDPRARQVGNEVDKYVTRRELIDSGASYSFGRGGFSGGFPGNGTGTGAPGDGTVYVPDLTPPPTATGLAVAAGISYIIIECDPQVYSQGHGHDRTIAYGAIGLAAQTATVTIASPGVLTLQHPPFNGQRIQLSTTGALPTGLTAGTTYYAVNASGNTCQLAATPGGSAINTSGSQAGVHTAAFNPTFANAVPIGEFQGTVWAYPTNPRTQWHIWIKWRSVDGVESTSPAGGTNGAIATTGEDPRALLDALTGQITESQLFSTLGAKITQIGTIQTQVNSLISAPDYDNGTAYVTGDVVKYLGKLYRAKTSTTGNLPTNATYWDKIGDFDSLAGVVAAHTLQLDDHESRITTNEGDITAEIAARTLLAATVGSNTAAIATETSARVSGDAANAASITALTATVGTNTAAIATEASVRASADGALQAQYTVKVDTNGYVSGFGLASTLNNATPFSQFLIRADSLAVASPSGPGLTPIVPFTVRTTPTTINGVPVPAGVYMDAAFILRGSITAAQIGNAVIDDAKIANLSAAKLTVGDGTVGGNLKSTVYTSGSAGWIVRPDGYAEFQNAIVRGTVTATAGAIGGNTINSTGVQSPGYTAGSAGWRIDSSGAAEFSGATVRGTVVATAGTIGGNTINASAVQSPGFVAGSAGWRLQSTGAAEFQNVVARGDIQATSLNAATGTFSGTLTAAAINAVNTINLAGQAVTIPLSTFRSTPAGTDANNIISVTINSTGAPILILVGSQVRGPSPISGATSLQLNLKRNGTVLTSSQVTLDSGADKASLNLTPYTDTPGAGTHVYSVDRLGAAEAYDLGMVVLETKR